jgi:dTDP-4-dehydrorhamnose reductase
MRVLITGAGGQVGHELVTVFSEDELFAADHATLDVTDRERVFAAFTHFQPEVVVHAAAWTAVDACETHPDRAYATNWIATRNVAEAARRVGARMTLFSTDYVFDGTKRDPYLEFDTPNPQCVYGRAKYAAEREVAADPNATIVRISWVCGLHGHNMVRTILKLAEQQATLRFVNDQRGHPTFAADVAEAVRRLIIDHRTGIYHVTNQGPVTWFEFARAVLESAGYNPERVEPIMTADLDPPRPARRPANSVLENAALRLQGLPLLPHYRESLDRLIAELERS